jgi:hypothetical protein
MFEAYHEHSDLEVTGVRAFYRPHGFISAGLLVDLITFVLQEVRVRKCAEVVLNVNATTGFESPGPAFRRWAVRRWATVSGGELRIALVARAEHICPERTGLIVAAEEGLHAHICAQEEEAVAWLDKWHLPELPA